MNVRFALCVSALWLMAATLPAAAATFTVDRTDDVSDVSARACTAAPNDCTLRGAIAKANAAPGSTVMLPDGMYQLALPGGLTISADVMVTGAGATSTSIDGQQVDRVFTISSGTVTFRDVTVTNGHTRGGFAGGGGIRNSGTLSLTDCVVSNNTSENAEGGGGIINLGTLTVTRTVVSGNQTQGGDGGGLFTNGGTVSLVDSVVSGNTAGENGGGVETFGGSMTLTRSTLSGNSDNQLGGGGSNIGGTLTITNCTISGNTSGSSGGGIYSHFNSTTTLNNVTITNNGGLNRGAGGGLANGGGTVQLANTIIAGNSDPVGGAPDCSAANLQGFPLVSQGYNLIGNTANCVIVGNTTGNVTGEAALLGSLQDNGGATQPHTSTHALLAGSPAINAGNPATPGSGSGACEQLDQRGLDRTAALAGGRCDIGAFEAEPPPTTTTTASTTTTSLITTTSTTPTTATTSTSSTTTAPSTSTTTTHVPTTTTTLPAGDCDIEPVAATFASIDCRLVALLGLVNTTPGLAAFGPKLAQNLTKAKDGEKASGTACAASNLKPARQGLKQAIRDMIQYGHHLKTLRARKKLPAGVREDLLAAGDPIAADVKTLKGAVRCPDDAPR